VQSRYCVSLNLNRTGTPRVNGGRKATEVRISDPGLGRVTEVRWYSRYCFSLRALAFPLSDRSKTSLALTRRFAFQKLSRRDALSKRSNLADTFKYQIQVVLILGFAGCTETSAQAPHQPPRITRKRTRHVEEGTREKKPRRRRYRIEFSQSR
jgi:hypothetical protein